MNNNAASEQMFPNIALKSFFMVIFALKRENRLHTLWEILKQVSYFSLVCCYLCSNMCACIMRTRPR